MSLDRDIKSSEWEPKGDLDYGSSGLQMSQEITSLKLGGDFGPESQANSILEYTGLTGNKLKTRMKTFRLSVNQGIATCITNRHNFIAIYSGTSI